MPSYIITGSGSFIPEHRITNAHFHQHEFYQADHQRLTDSGERIAQKFESITGIQERRYIAGNHVCSDMGTDAARKALLDANISGESLDLLIAAHNFGDVTLGSVQTDVLPGIGARIKHNLGIQNPDCVAWDILFGCPGWLQGMIQAYVYMRAGDANKAMVVGTETLSRVLDLSDRDSMIFADGAAATILERIEEDGRGILAYTVQTHTTTEAFYLNMGSSNKPGKDPGIQYIKMNGRKIYEYALQNVPHAMKMCLDKAGIPITAVDKILIHQANEKMDEAIVNRLYQLFGINQMPEGIMPMSIRELGNSSVATIPTLYDLIQHNKMEDHSFKSGDILLMASVGGGMHINAMVYRV